MFSVILRRSPITAQKVLHWARVPPKCWTSSVIRGTNTGSSTLEIRWASSTRPPTEWSGASHEQCSPAVFAFMRTEVFQNTQFHASTFTQRNQYFHSSAVRLKKREKPEPPPRQLDLLRYDMKDFWKSPKPALWLGFAGLIPFVAPPLFMGITESCFSELAYAQVAYGASIVSFLGGARWGFALPESSPAKPDWVNLSNSVVPPLLAWVSMLMADSIIPAATMVIMSLGILLHYDLSLLPTYPSWFKALRAVLTIVAFFSLLGTIILIGIYPEKKLFSE
ncbi:transmembrane protein 69-like [Dunckerocampus dactyliophorus]|uniref:transmembrane protein 69-like n=1 Tax=Dunckerocampus dactyliophorus TaxID=161453 RepID=UPI0024064A18|nr:transmembrane protein 69-like [Dunckerocampus dactyliophorus]